MSKRPFNRRMDEVRPTASGRATYEAVLAECERLGLPKPTLVSGGKHQKLLVTIDGKDHFLTMPRSPRSKDAEHMKVSDLRRLVRQVRSAA